MKSRIPKVLAPLALVLWALTTAGACTPNGPQAGQVEEQQPGPAGLKPVALDVGEKLRVVATTNIVGDVVSQVGGDRIQLTTLMGIGVDPHTYIPTPADTAAIHDAHVVFTNGGGLEADLQEMFESAGGEAVRIQASHGIEFRKFESGHQDEGGEGDHEHEEDDPHVWFDVQNAIRWVENIEQALSALDPMNSGFYEASGAAYIQELKDLDAWVLAQVALIPEANRKLVTNHPSFGYLADRYGLEQVGAVYPVSPSSEPSAQDIAALQDAIGEYGVPAVFAESTVNPKLAEQVAIDTGVKLIALYSGSLGGPESGVGSYVELIRYDVRAIVEALR
jgi:ABC-type Zn uptake system ZnuABC Zn-binding protein ZnuA